MSQKLFEHIIEKILRLKYLLWKYYATNFMFTIISFLTEYTVIFIREQHSSLDIEKIFHIDLKLESFVETDYQFYPGIFIVHHRYGIEHRY